MANFNAYEIERLKALAGTELASFPRRVLAFLADLVILSALFAVIASLLEPLLLKQGWIKTGDDIVFALNLNWYSVAWVVLYFGLATYFGRGKTPGKWLLRIRAVSLAHDRISLWHSVERALGYGLSLLEFGFGFFQYFIHPNKRTLHDRLAETIVIREKRAKPKEPVPDDNPPANPSNAPDNTDPVATNQI
jgi:uncharacterized RDD family membrane protein YckC